MRRQWDSKAEIHKEQSIPPFTSKCRMAVEMINTKQNGRDWNETDEIKITQFCAML